MSKAVVGGKLQNLEFPDSEVRLTGWRFDGGVVFRFGLLNLKTSEDFKRLQILTGRYPVARRICAKLWQQGVASFAITANTVICPLPSCMPDITITEYHFPT